MLEYLVVTVIRRTTINFSLFILLTVIRRTTLLTVIRRTTLLTVIRRTTINFSLVFCVTSHMLPCIQVKDGCKEQNV